MALFEWNNDLCIGIKKIDDQHKYLFSLINRLHEAMRSGQGNTILEEILGELVKYTETHFKDEEELMQKYGYPELAAHQEKHQAFVKQIQEHQAKFKVSKLGVSVEVMVFLKDWLVKHISGTDQLYAPLLKEKGAK